MKKTENLIKKALLEDTDWLYDPDILAIQRIYDLPRGCWMAAVPGRYIYVHGRVATQIAYCLIEEGFFREYEPEQSNNRYQHHIFLDWPKRQTNESYI